MLKRTYLLRQQWGYKTPPEVLEQYKKEGKKRKKDVVQKSKFNQPTFRKRS